MSSNSPERRHRILSSLFSRFFRYFRTRRIKLVYRRFNWNSETTIVDVGGSTVFWQLAREIGLPAPSVTIVNLEPSTEILPEKISWVVGDATQLPFRDKEFDIAFSNSVIEHLETKSAQVKMAKEVIRVARTYFVQTPNKWFPIEPHYITPFIHWVPPHIRLKLARNFTVWGLITRPSADYCRFMVNHIRLLDIREMSELFPASQIEAERFCGISKSILAFGKE